VSAYIGAAVKAKVTLVEANKMGGDCLNYGCVPSKALIKSAKVAQQMREAHHYGVLTEAPSISFPDVMARVQQVIKDIEPHDSVERYTKLGVDVVQGYAKLIDPWTVDIQCHDGAVQRLTSRAIVLATGASPVIPDIPGLAESGYLTSDTLWQTMAARETVPAHLVILGGGPIGCELAQAFARLGSQVTLIERSAQVLAREDEDVAAVAHASLVASGVTILTDAQVRTVENQTGQKRLQLMTAAGEQTLLCDDLLVAVGRTPRLTGFGLEELGLSVEHKLVTDDYLATPMPHIFAVGDVVGSYQFTHVAAHQAWYAAVNALFGLVKKFKVDYRVIPRATFLDPEIARVGLSEKEAQAQNIPYEVTRYGIDDLDRAIADGQAHGFVKVLTVPGKDTILGVTIVGEHASELLAEFVLAMKHGLGLNKILGTIHAYPTWAEANKYAAGEWKKAHAPERVLTWLARFHAWRRK
jgi:pyruvate/2-oxoglutarate dehydrogenase complex dihydrolipoamide dehydrogenase (E3) component